MKRFAQALVVVAIAFASYQTGQQRGVEYGKTLAPISGNMTFAYDDGEGWDLNFVAQANDAQMQQYANERIRVRAEQFRALVNACRDDQAAIDDIYDRAVNGDPWADNRTDGPPTLLDQQDMLVYNTVLYQFLKIIDGTETGTEQEIANQRAAYVADLRANWDQFQAACVRSVGN